jgi:hypothetical protein
MCLRNIQNKLLQHQKNVQGSCCEHVACNIQTSAGLLRALPGTTPKQPMLRPCCGRVACNIQHQEPSPPSLTQNPTLHVCNIKTQHLQHYNLMFTTSNIRSPPPPSTQHPTSRVCNIETQHSQHRKLMFAISKSTSELNTCNTCLKCLQHHNIWIYFCNINVKHFQHSFETSRTPKTYT